MKYFISFILTLLLAGCNLFQGQQQTEETVVEEAQKQQEEVFVPVEKELYVIDKEEREDYYLFGEKIKISAEGNEFYKTDRGDYIKKKDVGDWNTLKTKITRDDLTKNVDINGNSNDRITKYLNIDQISYEEYQEALRDKIDFLIEDTLVIVKKNGKLTFPCEHKTVYLKDQSDSVEDPFSTTYAYVGNVPILNQYLVFEDSEDFYAYIFIDKTTGKQTDFERFPFLSPDKKYIITIGRAYEDLVGTISLYRIKSIKPFVIETLVNEDIKWWATYDFDKEPIFFSKNGFLYAPMNVIPNFFDEHNNPNKQRMYIKVGIRN
ncbi:hypothetical protein JMN11_09950 [Capnocytophaga genosp. AHN8471]|uniref:hypothetical protein n=1 Tax=Capnocytophaga genosp. AHN8471 TaxID=327574 RepID=UPI0019321BA5|nr:hypothetical protein [Capnocytophaga genosp. AHN8471]MBM0653985.1 hypothetical protein [Capnocytophaga genosp. AHN8471]